MAVTRLSYGAMELRGEPRGRPVTDDQARIMLNAVLDSGINYIDTSNDYGRSEELVERFISSRRTAYSEHVLACGKRRFRHSDAGSFR